MAIQTATTLQHWALPRVVKILFPFVSLFCFCRAGDGARALPEPSRENLPRSLMQLLLFPGCINALSRRNPEEITQQEKGSLRLGSQPSLQLLLLGFFLGDHSDSVQLGEPRHTDTRTTVCSRWLLLPSTRFPLSFPRSCLCSADSASHSSPCLF